MTVKILERLTGNSHQPFQFDKLTSAFCIRVNMKCLKIHVITMCIPQELLRLNLKT